MKREDIWTWAAEMDAQEAFVQMEEAVEGSGLHLIQLVDQLIQLLREFPHMVTVWHSPIRKAGLRKTKYGLFYVPENGVIFSPMKNPFRTHLSEHPYRWPRS